MQSHGRCVYHFVLVLQAGLEGLRLSFHCSYCTLQNNALYVTCSNDMVCSRRVRNDTFSKDFFRPEFCGRGKNSRSRTRSRTGSPSHVSRVRVQVLSAESQSRVMHDNRYSRPLSRPRPVSTHPALIFVCQVCIWLNRVKGMKKQ